MAVLTLGGCRTPLSGVPAPATTEQKIALVGAVLEARDRGDFPTAAARLQELVRVAPNEASVQLLAQQLERAALIPRAAEGGGRRTEDGGQGAEAGMRTAEAIAPSATATLPAAAAPGSPVVVDRPTPPTVARPSASPPPVTAFPSGPVQIEPTPAAPPAPVVVGRAPAVPAGPQDDLSIALSQVEVTGAEFARSPGSVETLMNFLEAQRGLARIYADRGQNLLAAQTIDTMIASLRHNVSLYVAELRGEKRQFVRADIESREGLRLRHRR